MTAPSPHLLQLGDALNICIDCATMHPTWIATDIRARNGCRGCGALPVSTVPAADIASAVKFADPRLLRQQRLRIVECCAHLYDLDTRVRYSAELSNPWLDTAVLRDAWLASVGAVPVPAEIYALWLHTWLQDPDNTPRARHNAPLADQQRNSTTGWAYSNRNRFWMPTLAFLPDESPRFYGAASFDLLLLPHVSRAALREDTDLSTTRHFGHCEVYALRRQGRALAASASQYTRVASYTDVMALIDDRRAINRVRKLWTRDSLPVIAAA